MHRTGGAALRRIPLGSTPAADTVFLYHALRDSPSMLARFAVVLLDMNGTFMFGGDRFGPEQDFAATYHALGGRRLVAQVVQDGARACFETLGDSLGGSVLVTVFGRPSRYRRHGKLIRAR